MYPGFKQIAPGESFPGAIQEAQLAGASKGVALTTTAALTLVPDGTQQIELLLRNLAGGGVVGRWTTTPYLIVVKTTDLLTTVAAATDYSTAANNDTTGDVVLSSLSTLANGDALYVGSHVPFRGLRCINTAANGTASVLSGTYWKSDSTWANITLTDGTISPAGTTMGQSGNLTWTVPTDWAKATLATAVSGVAMGVPYRDNPLYWVRLVVSVALGATTLASIQAMSRSTAYAELIAAPPGREFRCHKGPGGIAGIEALTDAGTANLLINCFSRLGSDGLGL